MNLFVLTLMILSQLEMGFTGSSGGQPPTTSVVPNVSWNRYETQNFEILSINKEQGVYLYQNVEYLRKWTLERWGIKSVDYSTKCKIMIAPDKDTYVKLFKKDKTGYVADGKSIAIWMYAEPKWHVDSLPQALTAIGIAEFERKYNVIFPLWLKEGMSLLNTSIGNIKSNLGELTEVFSKDNAWFWSKDLLNMTPDKLAKYEVKHRGWFAKESAMMCLYLIKEHGPLSFNNMLNVFVAKEADPLAALRQVGYADYEKFDLVFYKYMYSLAGDILNRKTPDSYLTWSFKTFSKEK